MLLPCFMDHKFSVMIKDYLLAKGLSSNFSIKNCRGQKFLFLQECLEIQGSSIGGFSFHGLQS